MVKESVEFHIFFINVQDSFYIEFIDTILFTILQLHKFTLFPDLNNDVFFRARADV